MIRLKAYFNIHKSNTGELVISFTSDSNCVGEVLKLDVANYYLVEVKAL